MLYSHVETSVILVAAFLSASSYRRRGRGYAAGKDVAISSPTAFRLIYRYVQVSTLTAALAAIYTDSAWLLKISLPHWLGACGTAFTVCGLIVFLYALRAMGPAYSPCFDSYVPRQIVTAGPYHYIRHPIYAANLALLAGMFLMSGSLWVAANFLIVVPFYIYSSRAEEHALANSFPHYRSYMALTGSFLPRINCVRRRTTS